MESRFFRGGPALWLAVLWVAVAGPVRADGGGNAQDDATVELKPEQLTAITIAPVGTDSFPVEVEALGSVDFDEDSAVAVFPSYQGKILEAFAKLGDEVRPGQPLYTIDSPDLVQAEGNLIGAAAADVLYSNELVRASLLAGTNGVSLREHEQAVNDAQTAEGALRAARDAVRIFGKSEAEMDTIIATRKIDPALVVVSPVSGRVTARNAQPGLLAQPGNAPAPYTVADLSTKWLVANVSESDSPQVQPGQPVRAELMALPGREFSGTVDRMGSAVDPNTRRVMLRCELADPANELTPGMMASFRIQVRPPVTATALPMTGVIRNGDGTMAVWVTTDRRRFVQRLVRLGRQYDGRYEILSGVSPGELAVTEGGVFLSNILYAPPAD
jgi:cobalt-zinc-cadmium efflux system membrane fusion protein